MAQEIRLLEARMIREAEEEERRHAELGALVRDYDSALLALAQVEKLTPKSYERAERYYEAAKEAIASTLTHAQERVEVTAAHFARFGFEDDIEGARVEAARVVDSRAVSERVAELVERARVEEQRQAHVAALLRERYDMLSKPESDPDHLAAIDEQLVHYGHVAEAPAKRASKRPAAQAGAERR
jgi:hypothetical protein